MKNHYPVKILYFALEDSKEKIIKKIICHYLYERHRIQLSFHDMNSRFKALDNNVFDLISKDDEFYMALEKMLFVIDNCASPNQIREACNIAQRKGTIKDNDHVITIIDNYDNVIPDKEDKDKWSAINRLSSQIIRLDLCKVRNFSVVSVLQADMEQEKHSFRAAATGKVAISSLEPSLASIGGSKEVARHVHLLFGIFNPWRYEIETYPNHEGYNTKVLRNNFRSLLLLKTNDGEIPYGGRLGLFFNGAVEEFVQLPSIDEKGALESIYHDVQMKQAERRNAFVQKQMFG